VGNLHGESITYTEADKEPTVTSCEYGDGGIGDKEKRGEEHRGKWKRKSKRTGIIGMIDIADAIISSAIASRKKQQAANSHENSIDLLGIRFTSGFSTVL
jgi:hypothetical protein